MMFVNYLGIPKLREKLSQISDFNAENFQYFIAEKKLVKGCLEWKNTNGTFYYFWLSDWIGSEYLETPILFRAYNEQTYLVSFSAEPKALIDKLSQSEKIPCEIIDNSIFNQKMMLVFRPEDLNQLYWNRKES